MLGRTEVSGKIDPGAYAIEDDAVVSTTGELSIAGDCIMEAGSALRIDIASSGTDSINVTPKASMSGDLTLSKSNPILDINFPNQYVPAPGQKYEVASYTGDLTGVFSNAPLPGVPIDTTHNNEIALMIEYDTDNKDINLTTHYIGDANMDNAVNLLDLSTLASNFDTTPATWSMGNFNTDNTVDLLDLSALATNFGKGQTSQSQAPESFSSIGSPATLSLDGDLTVSDDGGITTPDLTGYTTYTLTAAALTDSIDALEILIESDDLNQEYLGYTIFSNNNVFLQQAGINPLRDSQLLFAEGLLSVQADESDTLLTAAFAGFTPFTTRDIAQIVIPDDATATYEIQAVIDDELYIVTGTLGTAAPLTLIPIPEPSSLAVLALTGLALVRRRAA
ncbi:hypothetical protein [Mucisphaera calidilacus]|uniref:hypothetical protein n=1 Tax=Mucisphaera calidilacus TaxID=2527982 RepID=UPI0011A26F08|nr:hypothetical protein [Mucisphaera calidilacus]